MKSIAAWRLSLAALFAFGGLLAVLALGTVSSTALPMFQPQVANAQSVCPAPLALVNGDMESPEVPDSLAETPPGWIYFPEHIVVFPASALVGWQTNAAPTDYIGELWENGNNFIDPGFPVPANTGDQFAEVATGPTAALYQDLDTTTVQGMELEWSFAHRGRSGVDTLEIKIGAPGAEAVIQTVSTGNTAWQIYSGTYIVPVGQTVTRLLWNSTATASGNPGSGNFVDTVVLGTPGCEPSLEIEKTSDVVDASTLVAGDEITYSFDVTNTGNIPLTNVTVTDPLPDLSAITPASVPTLAVDAVETFTATYIVTQADIDSGQILNTATALSDVPIGCNGCAPPTDTDEYVLPIPRTPGITIDKTADPTEGLVVGDTVTYTFVATNIGNVTLTNVTVTDTLPGISPIDPASVATLAPLGTANFTATYVVTQADVDNGEIVNSATATGTPPPSCTSCPPPESPPDEVIIVIPPLPDHTIVKTADPTTGVNEGDTITYTFVATNTGNVTLTNFTLVDPLPGLTWVTGPNLGTIAPGDDATGSATYVVTAEDVVNNEIANSVTATCDGENCPPRVCAPGDPCWIVVYPGDPGVLIEKTADPASGVAEGDVITYSFTATNTGEVTLHDVTLVDILPGLTWVVGPDLGDLLPGDIANGSATYVVTAEDIAAGEIVNSATATCSPVCDPPPAVVIVEAGVPNVTFDKVADTAGPVNAGDVITYTFTATNTGDATAPNVVIADQLAGLEWVTGPELGDILEGESAEGTATYTVTEADIVNGGVTNVATVTCDSGCGDVPPITVFIPGGPDPGPGTLIVEKTSDATGEEVHPGDLITYTFTVTNNGGSSVDNVTVTDPLLGLSAIEGPHGITLAPGEIAVFTATYPVTEADANAGTIVNTATGTGTDVTGTPLEDDDTVTLAACSIPGAPEVTPTPGDGSPEPVVEIDVAQSEFEGAADCEGPAPTEVPGDPEPTKPSGGGGPVVKLPSTGQPNGTGSGFSPILPISVLILLGLAMMVSLIQRRRHSGR